MKKWKMQNGGKMNQFTYVAPCHFGLEAMLKREIQDLGYKIIKVEDGKVTFQGDENAVPRANMFLRTTERILIQVGRFRAVSFEELFEKVKAIPWEQYLTEDSKFWVKKATSIKSKLYSIPDIQSIVKKAMVERMKQHYKVSWFSETGASYPVRIVILKDEVVIGLDTSGESLHKRGYRKLTSKAPLTETLAAALIMLTPWRKDRIFVDPFCGSGTFPIEAAMMAANMAPGINRSFEAENWKNLIPVKAWYRAFDEAHDLVNTEIETNIQGYDIDGRMIKCARENAKEAGVDHLIHFQERPVSQLNNPKKYGFIVTNPPYGERLEEKEMLPDLYEQIGEGFERLDTWSKFVLTSYEDAEKYIGKKADKNRKIYNGMLKTYYYQWMGPRPPRKNRENENC